jgi:ankyrin repeat protein
MIVRLLLLRGAEKNARCFWRKYTPLQIAASAGHVGTVRVLLAAGADHTVLGSSLKQSLLHLAAGFGETGASGFGGPNGTEQERLEIIKLLDNKLNVRAQDVRGWTVLDQAAWVGWQEIVKYLVGLEDFTRTKDNLGRDAMFRAADGYRPSRDMIFFMIRSGFDVRTRNNLGQTPLHETMEKDLTEDRDRLENTLILVEFGADPMAVDEFGQTALDKLLRGDKDYRLQFMLRSCKRTFEDAETVQGFRGESKLP